MSEIDLRSTYLLEWWKGLWESIRQKEDGIWKFISFFAAAVVLVVGFAPKFGDLMAGFPLSALVIIAVILLFTYWGTLIILDANYWLARNLLFISNVERDVLPSEDIGTLIPEAYVYPGFRYSRLYSLHTHIMFVTLALTLIIGIGSVMRASSLETAGDIFVASLVCFVFVGGLAFVLIQDRHWIDDYHDDSVQAEGSNREQSQRPRQFEVHRSSIESPVWLWGWMLTSLGTGLFLSLAYLNQSMVAIDSRIAVAIVAISIVVAVLGLVLRYVVFTKSWLGKLEDNLGESQSEKDPEAPASLIRVSRWPWFAELGVLIALALTWLSFALVNAFGGMGLGEPLATEPSAIARISGFQVRLEGLEREVEEVSGLLSSDSAQRLSSLESRVVDLGIAIDLVSEDLAIIKEALASDSVADPGGEQ